MKKPNGIPHDNEIIDYALERHQRGGTGFSDVIVLPEVVEHGLFGAYVKAEIYVPYEAMESHPSDTDERV